MRGKPERKALEVSVGNKGERSIVSIWTFKLDLSSRGKERTGLVLSSFIVSLVPLLRGFRYHPS